MDHQSIATELIRNREVFRNLLEGLSAEQYLWKPASGKWCLLEMICHLYDEEREDFRAQVRSVLTDPAQALAPIDPAGWVTSRKYMQKDYDNILRSFITERTISVHWLHALEAPHWENTHQHPKFGPLSAALFLHNWLAHDYYHIRQITNLKYQYLASHCDQSLKYAGDW